MNYFDNSNVLAQTFGHSSPKTDSIKIQLVKDFAFFSRTHFFKKNGPFPSSFSLFLSFQYTVDSKQMFNKFCR